MSSYNLPTYKIQPFLSNQEELEHLEQVMDLLQDEQDEELKSSGMITQVLHYKLVTEYYDAWDDEANRSFWEKEFIKEYPDALAARILQSQNSGKSLKENSEIEDIFREEIDLIIHGKPSDKIFLDDDIRNLVFWLGRYFTLNGKIDSVKALFKFARLACDMETIKELVFMIRNEERGFPSTNEEDDVIEWINDLVYSITMTNQTKAINPESYILLNKDTESFSEKEILDISSLQDLDNLKRDMRWVFLCGLNRFTTDGENKKYNFFFNLIYAAAQHRIYEILELTLKIFENIPIDVFNELVGDIGFEIMMQPYSILAIKKPELFVELITSSNCPEFGKSIFFEILCYTARKVEDKTIYPPIKECWNFAKNNETELLGYFIGAIVDQEITGYKDEINEVYESGVINFKIFDKIEDFEPITNMRVYEAESISTTSLESMLNSYKKRINSIGQFRRRRMTLEEEIDSILEETIAKDLRYEEQLESFLLEEQLSMFDEDIIEPSKVIDIQKKVGRNDPCPCGSGKKYKKCCLNMN